LLIGHGHSAAHAIAMLDQLATEASATRVVWAVRVAHARPCCEVANDPLPERQAVVEHANRLAQAPPAYLRLERRAHVERFDQQGDAWAVTLSGERSVVVDTVVALTGYRPDLAILSELALEIAPATEGSARLARALTQMTDCLSVPQLSDADLQSGEPGFHLIGAKSYGRARTFLLQTGIGQLQRILDSWQA
jgi:hypothetical protein